MRNNINYSLLIYTNIFLYIIIILVEKMFQVIIYLFYYVFIFFDSKIVIVRSNKRIYSF